MAKEALKYWKADDVQSVASELIKQFHPHLAGESIIYLFRSEHEETNGKPVFGKAKRVSGLNAYLANRADIEEMNGSGDNPADKEEAPPIRLIEIAFDVWTRLNSTQRIALVDHELCHFGNDGMCGHDVEEFRAVIDRHGLWRPEIELLAASMAQFKLFPAGPEIESKPAKTNVGAAFVKELKNPKSRAAKRLRPKKGSHISKVTISSGRKSVTLRAKD